MKIRTQRGGGRITIASLRAHSVANIAAAPHGLQDVFGGHVPMMLAAVATAFPYLYMYIKDGRLVPILTCVQVPGEMPTRTESGDMGFELVPRMGGLSAD